MQTTKAIAVELEIERLQTAIDNRTKHKSRRKFKVQYRGVIRVADAKDILKAKTEADKLQVETKAQQQAYIAEQKAKIKSAEYCWCDRYMLWCMAISEAHLDEWWIDVIIFCIIGREEFS